jgi:DNA topoisomerase-1
MSIAQGLYENGHITYMRTDSVSLSSQAISAARSAATELYGAKSVPSEPRLYKGKSKNAQEAHEAVRPAGDRFATPSSLSSVLPSPPNGPAPLAGVMAVRMRIAMNHAAR